MLQLATHQEFFQHTKQLADELTQIENQARSQEEQLLTNISALTEDVREMAFSAVQGPLQDALKGYFEQTTAVLEGWENRIRNYDAGLRFRKQFGDSLLIFVYGKVKAGKSALGNFIACGRTVPDEEWLEQLPEILHAPHYFGGETNHEFGEIINHKQGFKVGEAETTSCIQGFTVPGLTWIDSPGLHSVNTENGELAQKYVESADLIIYPMNSAQPGRQTDLHELETLLKAGKRIVVLITRCDILEQDVDDNGQLIEQLVMKSAQSRSDQEQHVQAGLDALCQKLGIKDADTSVLTVSVGYAEANGNSHEAMQQSGMLDLFEKLRTVLHSEGIELKKSVPQDNLHAFYRLLLTNESELSFSRLLVPLEDAIDKLKEQENKLVDMRRLAQTRVEHTFAERVDNIVDKYAENRNIQALEQESNRLIDDAISEHYRAPLKSLYQDVVDTLQGAVQDMGLCVGLNFEDQKIDVSVDISRKSAAIGSGAGAVIGGIIGFFVGGPPGAAIGSGIGSLAGAAAGSAFNSQEQRTILAGDNREEIKATLQTNAHKQIDKILTELNQQVITEIISPIQTAINTVLQQTLDFHDSIKEQTLVRTLQHPSRPVSTRQIGHGSLSGRQQH